MTNLGILCQFILLNTKEFSAIDRNLPFSIIIKSVRIYAYKVFIKHEKFDDNDDDNNSIFAFDHSEGKKV